MQENEFEKQVKKTMEDFRLSPSASALEKVQSRLSEKKRRRAPFFFLLAAGLITAGYFTYYIAETHNQNSAVAIINNNNANDHKLNTIDIKESSAVNKKTDSNKQSEDNNYLKKDSVKRLQYDISKYEKEKVSVSTNNNFVINKKIKRAENNVSLNEKHKSISFKQQPNTQNLKETNNDQILNGNAANKPSTTTSSSEAVYDSSAIATNNTQDATKNISFAKNDSIELMKNDQFTNSRKVVKATFASHKNPNWKFGITVSYGRSKLIEDTKQFNGVPAYLNSNTGSTPNINARVINPHPFSSSNAYSFGVIIQKKIFKEGYITSGLKFTHFATNAKVNSKIDSSLIIQTSNDINSFYSINGYYQSGSFRTYTSNYNFIELPVSFQQYFFQSKQISISYNAGVSIGRLLSSNAIFYNPNNNIYFSKDNFLRKTQFQFLAGMNVEINSSKNNSFFIGPQFSYTLSNLAKNKNNGSFHFINYGLQAGFLLHKK
jgi:hypothetical protein